jgi:hypothetical protein
MLHASFRCLSVPPEPLLSVIKITSKGDRRSVHFERAGGWKQSCHGLSCSFTVSPDQNPLPEPGIGDVADSLAPGRLRSPQALELYPDFQSTATSRFPGIVYQ